MIADFWLGALAMASVAMGVTITAVAMLVAWLAKKLAAFAHVEASKGEDGQVTANIHIRREKIQ